LPSRGPRVAAKDLGSGQPAAALAEAGERAQRCKLAHQRAVADAVAAAIAEEGAQIGRLQGGDRLQRRGRIEMMREESGELLDVATIGLERLRREPALMAEMGEPVAPEGVEIAHHAILPRET